MKKHPSKKKAFTFIEVLAALAIVAMALVALIRLQLVSIDITDKTDLANHAALLADEKISQFLTHNILEPGTTRGSTNYKEHDFHWQTEVSSVIPSEMDPDDMDRLHRLRVDVNWQQGRHKKYFNLTTYTLNHNTHEIKTRK
ncbi:MAG: type II secretion system protein [Sedimentisphaerales bacterium]|nr:type II secretion system protein [Sedimentisphaerales bacterium]